MVHSPKPVFLIFFTVTFLKQQTSCISDSMNGYTQSLQRISEFQEEQIPVHNYLTEDKNPITNISIPVLYQTIRHIKNKLISHFLCLYTVLGAKVNIFVQMNLRSQFKSDKFKCRAHSKHFALKIIQNSDNLRSSLHEP